MSEHMNITLNGKPKDLPAGTSLKTLVEQTAKNPAHVIAEMNGVIIERNRWDDTTIPEGAVIELVTFVGGG